MLASGDEFLEQWSDQIFDGVLSGSFFFVLVISKTLTIFCNWFSAIFIFNSFSSKSWNKNSIPFCQLKNNPILSLYDQVFFWQKPVKFSTKKIIVVQFEGTLEPESPQGRIASLKD